MASKPTGPPETKQSKGGSSERAGRHVDRTDEIAELRHAGEQQREARYRAIHDRPRFYGLQIDPEVDFYPEVRDRHPGDTNLQRWGFDLHLPVTVWSAGLLGVFITATLLWREQAADVFSSVLDGMATNFGWLLIAAVNIIIVGVVAFGVSKFGRIRLGGPEAQPEFSRVAWYAMLLSAGMGIGLMFWAVAEPISHLGTPSPLFDVGPGTPAAAERALVTTWFHWGVHPWAVYALVSMALGFFAYNRGLPLTFRSVFYPLLGRRIYGGWGNAIDVLTVLATLFGLATSLGLGAGQVAAGLHRLFGWPETTVFQVVLIGVVTAAATVSVMAGLDAGVKRLSQLNLMLAGAFLAFVMLVGPTLFLLEGFVQGLGRYTATFPLQSAYTSTFDDGGWQGEWTVFYWGWWVSWSPFVGMFIARISKGRSIRDLVASVVLVPSLLSFAWLATFGGSALHTQLTGAADIAGAVASDVSTALFELLSVFPLTTATSVLGVALVASFFVTSSDSGSLVVDHLTSGGKLDSPKPQRVFWAVMEGTIAAVLLLGGGLDALQTAAISTGLPFALVLLLMLWSLYRAFSEELAVLGGGYEQRRTSQRLHTVQEVLGRRGPGEPPGDSADRDHRDLPAPTPSQGRTPSPTAGEGGPSNPSAYR